MKNSVCKFWYNLNKCWYSDFRQIICDFFNCEEETHIVLKESEQYVKGLEYFGFSLVYSDKLDTSPIVMQTIIKFNGRRLGEKVKDKFNLVNWEIVAKSLYSGDDDTYLVFKQELILKAKNIVEEHLKNIKSLMQEIIKYEKIINTCQICKQHNMYLTEYCGIAICKECENKIITSNIKDFKINK
jgi:hypothetical protein